jgi:hypothetical protein
MEARAPSPDHPAGHALDRSGGPPPSRSPFVRDSARPIEFQKFLTNRTYPSDRVRFTCNRRARLLVGPSEEMAVKYLAGTLLLALATGALAEDVRDIELRRLFEPTDAEQAAEAKGRIHIYDGLRDTDVQRALDEEFERVDNMMFIRTRKTDASGEVKRDDETGEEEYEDDGC